MNNFPLITNISDILPHIEGRDEFVVADKGEYTIINYNVIFEDTFPNLDISSAMFRRECRGIAFCNQTGKILRRPLHKFFNINERDETQLHNLDFGQPHWVDEKLDGSMICPILVNGDIVWATKMAAPDFHELVLEFVNNSPIDYDGFVRDQIYNGYSPIFEFLSKKKRIVIDYPEDNLVLLAVRNMKTGEYVDITNYSVPMVNHYGIVEDPKSFLEYVHDLKNAEGFVIRWKDGYRVKVKAHEYLQIHRAKEAILQDRNIVAMILDQTIDDIKANLPEEDRDRLTRFENDFNDEIAYIVIKTAGILYDTVGKIDRKKFAIEVAPSLDPFMRPIIFKNFEGYSLEKIYDDVHNVVRNNLSRTVKYEAIRDAWFSGIYFNER